MRRNIIILCLLLVVPAGIVSAGYPEDYFGPPVPEGCIEIEAYVPDGWFHDRNPWSMPSPEENIIWFGMLCVEGGVAALEFTHLGSRRCYEDPWGFERCYAGYLIEISEPDRHVMAWDPDFDPDWGFYIASVHSHEWIWKYDSLTNNGDGTMTFVEGAFEYVQPLWYVESDNYTRWKFLVSEKHTPTFGVRTTTGRRVGK